MKRILFALPGLLFCFNTLCCGANLAGDEVVFNTNFDSGAPVEFTGGSTVTSVQGYAGIGSVGNQFGGSFLRNEQTGVDLKKATLNLTGLRSHTSVDIDFLLAIIDSWDGVGSPAGPDRLNVTVDGNTIFSEVFENSGSGVQTYVPGTGVELARRQELGFTPGTSFYGDSAYDMGLDPVFNGISHSSDTLTIEWVISDSTTWQGFTDESWALDNVVVTIRGSAIPEPASGCLLVMVGIGFIACQRRKRPTAQ